VLLCAAIPCSFSQEGEIGKVDWIKGTVIGYGFGTAPLEMNKSIARITSIRAAKVDAMRNLLETVKSVSIDSYTKVQDFIVQSDVISARVSGIIKGAYVIDTKTDWENGLPFTMVMMGICINSEGEKCTPEISLVSALNLSNFKDSLKIPQKNYLGPSDVNTSEPSPVQTLPKDFDYQYDSVKPTSGVVFRLMGLYFKKVVLPVVGTEENEEINTVYSVNRVEPRIVRTYGIVRYADKLSQLKVIEKIGDNFIIVPVKGVTEDNIILIGGDGARKIYETTRHGNNYLNEAHVVICYE
jgi:hypothetical protein